MKELLPAILKEHKRIIFNGNNYSEEWRKEAAKRGLLNLSNTVDALPELAKADVVKTFEKYKVLNGRELHARYEITLETYVKTVNVEAQLMVLMANRYILPAALRYQTDVAESVNAVKAAGGTTKEAKKLLDKISGLVDDLRRRTDALAKALEHHSAVGGEARQVHARHDRAGHGKPSRIRRSDRGRRPARGVAAAHVPRDVVYQVVKPLELGDLQTWGFGDFRT